MKHCFLCRWSFPTIEFSEGEDPALKPVLKCWPNGDRDKEQMANEVCKFYQREDDADEVKWR